MHNFSIYLRRINIHKYVHLRINCIDTYYCEIFFVVYHLQEGIPSVTCALLPNNRNNNIEKSVDRRKTKNEKEKNRGRSATKRSADIIIFVVIVQKCAHTSPTLLPLLDITFPIIAQATPTDHPTTG